MANVLLLTWGSGGDVVPIVQIGSGLKARGHEVTLITHCVYEERARQAGLAFAGLDTPEEARRLLKDKDELVRPPEFRKFFEERLLPRFPQEYQAVEQRYRAGDTLLVGFDPSRITGQTIAEKLNIPFVLFLSAPKSLEDRLGRFATTKSNVERASSILARLRAAIGMPPPQDLGVWDRIPASRIAHWPEWFAPPRPELPFPVTPIGFIFDQSPQPLPAEVQAFLEAGPPPILITHGTSQPKDAAFFQASVAACRRLGQRGLLVTSHAALVPEPLPAGVAWFRYVPYGSLTPRVRAIVHHGGLGTVGAAMLAGIPQLILPAGFDRRDNAINLRRLGIGDFVRPPQWRAETIAEALARLLDSPAVQARCREIARRVKDADPVALACEIIEGVLAGKADGTAAQTRQSDGLVVLESTLDQELHRRLSHLSPEKRALLAARLAKKAVQGC